MLCITALNSRILPYLFRQIFVHYYFCHCYCAFLPTICCCVWFVVNALSNTLLIIISIIHYICHYKFQFAQIFLQIFAPANIVLCLLKFMVCCCFMHIEINSVYLFCFSICILIKFFYHFYTFVVFALYLYRFSLHKFILRYFGSPFIFPNRPQAQIYVALPYICINLLQLRCNLKSFLLNFSIFVFVVFFLFSLIKC